MKIVHAQRVRETTTSLIGLHYSVDQDEHDVQHFDDNGEKVTHHVDEQEEDEMADESIR
jgi:hypothetical protein